MIAVHDFAHRPVAVFGLGHSGVAAARSLTAGGARVSAWDDDPAQREAAAAAGVPLDDLYDRDFTDLAALVLSPGVPLTHPAPHRVVVQARKAACPVIGDVELFARCRLPARVIGITGTNGKSTTTALIGHMLGALVQPAAVGGNLGTPVLDLPPFDREGIYVLELSSFQLDLTTSLVCDVAVLLNLGSDHLDRHGDRAGYVAVKKRIFAGQRSDHTAIIGRDDDHADAIYRDLAANDRQRVVPVAVGREVTGGVYVLDGILHDATGGDVVRADLSEAKALRGVHNWQNAAAAVAAVRALGLPGDRVAASVASFPGLAHRLEKIAVIGGVRFINDSKATNVAAAARALASFERVYWIAGGRAKQDSLESLAPLFPRIAHAFLIGEATAAFAAVLEGRVPLTRAGELATALDQAARQAFADVGGAGDKAPVVLLSPACASFDQWPNFEARGEAFRAHVQALVQVHGAARPEARP